MRPRGEDEPPRSIFGQEGVLARDEAYRLLDAHQARGYLAHRLMLSPSDDERPEDLRAMTYRVMRELERGKGQRLAWVAVEHRNTDQPHVHVVLAGGGEAPDGRVSEVRLSREDHARMKGDAADYCRAEARVREDWDRALDAAARAEDGNRATARSRATRGVDRDDWSP